MRVTLDAAGPTLQLDFGSTEALASFANDWRAREGCLVRLPDPLKLWTQLTIELRQEGAFRLAVEARVVQVFGGGEEGFATAFEATEIGPLAAFAPRPPKPSIPAPDDSPPPAAGDDGEIRGASPIFRIRAMNISEKIHLASRATLNERQILLRDGSPQVLMALLANPRIEDKEILVLAKSPSASSGVLQRIAKDRRWSTHYEIRLALVKNPQTPTPLAVGMMETLPEKDLRALAKGANVREAVRAAALRKVVKR